MRNPKRYVRTVGGMKEAEGCNYGGMTKFLLIIYKAVPGIIVGSANTTEKVHIGLTRKYLYKVEGMNEARDRYITA